MQGSIVFKHPKYNFAIAKGHYSDSQECAMCGSTDVTGDVLLTNKKAKTPKAIKVHCKGCLRNYELTFGDFENSLDTIIIYNYE